VEFSSKLQLHKIKNLKYNYNYTKLCN